MHERESPPSFIVHGRIWPHTSSATSSGVNPCAYTCNIRLIDLRAQAEAHSARKTDTPTQLALVDVTPLFSLRENAIAKEPALR